MPINRVYKKTDIAELQHFLNGGIVGAPFPYDGFYGLVGKTLIFTSPSAVTVTFTASVDPNNPDPSKLTLKDLHDQIAAAIATVSALGQGGRLALLEFAPASGIALDKDGTANVILGFSKTEDTVGKYYAPPDSGVVPRWTWSNSVNENNHVVFTLE